MGQIDFNKLWANFMDTVQNHYMDFTGRLGRAQYWYFILVCFAVSVAAAILDGIIGRGLIGAVVGLALLLPTAGASARRMQDSGNNGQLVWVYVIAAALYYLIGLLAVMSGPLGALGFIYFFLTFGWLIGLVMLVAGIAIIYFCVQPGQTGDNAYGPPPPAWTPNA